MNKSITGTTQPFTAVEAADHVSFWHMLFFLLHQLPGISIFQFFNMALVLAVLHTLVEQ